MANQYDEYGNPLNTPEPVGEPQPSGGTPAQITAAYRKYLGRAPEPGAVDLHQKSPSWESDISNSAEAKAYAQRAGILGTVTPPTQPVGSPPTFPAGEVISNPSNAAGRGVNPQQYYRDYITNFGLQASQGNPTSLQPLVNAMRTEGYDATLAAPSSGGYVKGIMLNGRFVKLLDGTDRQIWDESGSTSNQPPSGYTPGTINGSAGGSSAAPISDPTGPAVQAAILRQLGTLQNPTDPNSATVHAITDPYHLASQRGLEQTRRALAEQAYASGNLNTGGYAGSQIAAVENAGANEANFTGQTVATQDTQRQAMLLNILGLGTNVSEFTQQLSATQKNFADSLAQNDRQFAASLAANVAQFGQSLGYQQALFDWTRLQTGIAGATAPVPA